VRAEVDRQIGSATQFGYSYREALHKTEKDVREMNGLQADIERRKYKIEILPNFAAHKPTAPGL